MTCCVACSARPAQRVCMNVESSSSEREEMEGKVELRRKVRSIFLDATIFSTAAANLCLDMSSCRLCAFYIFLEVNHELTYPPALPRSDCCLKPLFQPKHCISWCSLFQCECSAVFSYPCCWTDLLWLI